MFVELRLYHTLATFLIAIQWLPLCAINPCSPVKVPDGECEIEEEPIGVAEMLPNCCKAFDRT